MYVNTHFVTRAAAVVVIVSIIIDALDYHRVDQPSCPEVTGRCLSASSRWNRSDRIMLNLAVTVFCRIGRFPLTGCV